MKTITITDPMQVEVGDKAYFKDCDFGFDVIDVNTDDEDRPIVISNPLSGFKYRAFLSRFTHATREVYEPEWPDPHDIRLHVYLGSDGKRYLYNPRGEQDAMPWSAERRFASQTREEIEDMFPEALPLTELKLVPVKGDDGE
jgi:hypothetical protein